MIRLSDSIELSFGLAATESLLIEEYSFSRLDLIHPYHFKATTCYYSPIEYSKAVHRSTYLIPYFGLHPIPSQKVR